MAILAGFDQGTNLTGYCVGDGSETPEAWAWRFDDLKIDDLGGLGRRYRENLVRLYERTRFTHAIYEAPFLDRYRDKTIVLRGRFGIDMILEEFCETNGVVLEEAPFGQLKRELAGSPRASKDDMIASALKLGVKLPKADAAGREDAADACAAWLIGLRHYARQHQQRWDAKLYGARGALL